MNIISMGAEAVLIRDEDFVIKKRVPKNYRLPEIDKSIRGFRTRREAKVLEKLNSLGVRCPKIQSCDGKSELKMEFVDGKKLKDCASNQLMAEVGRKIGLMHKNGIIHSDLTTSNMLVKEGSLYFIDFGLSYFSEKEEDKAVDLQVFWRALQSTHSDYESFFNSAIEGYKESYLQAGKVLERLETVEKRGRNKKK